jgi:DNA-binding NarL/FixJ family response regulator
MLSPAWHAGDMRLKVLIADDHELMVEAVRIALSQQEDEFEVVATTSRGTQVLPLISQTEPDLVLLDLRMPGMDGLACLEQIRKRHPRVKTIVLSGLEGSEVMRSAFNLGATAFIHKHIDPRDLPSALRQAAQGTVVHQTFGAVEDDEDLARSAGLSEKEITILNALAEGLSNREIAQRFWLAEQTVKFHLTNIYRKLQVGSRTEAVRAAYERGLIVNPVIRRAGNTEDRLSATHA